MISKSKLVFSHVSGEEHVVKAHSLWKSNSMEPLLSKIKSDDSTLTLLQKSMAPGLLLDLLSKQQDPVIVRKSHALESRSLMLSPFIAYIESGSCGPCSHCEQ